jgi:hypothetical protein
MKKIGSKEIKVNETTMESDYYINFDKQITCKECPFRKSLGLDEEEDINYGN